MRDRDQPVARGLLAVGLDGVLEVAEQHVDLVGARSGTLAAIFSLLGSKKWIMRDGRNGISRTGSGAPIASGAEEVLRGTHGASIVG